MFLVLEVSRLNGLLALKRCNKQGDTNLLPGQAPPYMKFNFSFSRRMLDRRGNWESQLRVVKDIMKLIETGK